MTALGRNSKENINKDEYKAYHLEKLSIKCKVVQSTLQKIYSSFFMEKGGLFIRDVVFVKACMALKDTIDSLDINQDNILDIISNIIPSKYGLMDCYYLDKFDNMDARPSVVLSEFLENKTVPISVETLYRCD